ncbi:DMT family transporter [Phytohabitans sp. ZYX-F-186]|uniref:DMT family transporter n=1 Tax=Phytohabitans maris TaxID=3071409 RepID=A0ABU0ZIA2_9ACTN|nr:DMT family transporter [Phytohabitans sp. ZYX-F-186]MDQ7906779.1 DMT family transporter [Phytohabitans sp. ZYX-F-186]
MHHRLDPLTLAAIGLAVVSVSSSAPLIAYAAAPALAIAFWRNFLAVGVLGPAALVRRRAELRDMVTGGRRREARYSVLAGLALAVHFATWMPSAQLTSVATATALVATQPVWQGLLALARGRRLRPVMWVGIGIAVAGAAIATGADLGTSGRAIAGDLLALAGAVAVAVYTDLGERARAALSTTAYTLVCYSVCAAALLVACLVGGARLGGYGHTTWLAILGLVAGAQLLGHSMFNYALHKVSATTISMLILLEVPGSVLIAWLWLGQVPRAAAYPGLALLVVGVAVVVAGGARTLRQPPEPAA